MSDDEDIGGKPEPASMGTITLMLGLYLILLAFFILLNAISQFVEEKVEEVSESVGEGFGFNMEGKARMREEVESTMAPVFKLLAQEIQSLMESYISVKDFRFLQEDGNMRLTIDAAAFFEDGQTRIRPEQAEFFTEVAKLVEKPRPGMVMDCDVMVTANADAAEEGQMPAMELAGRRSTIFARALINKGIMSERVTAAAIDGKENKVFLTFFVHIHNSMKALKEAREALGLEGMPKVMPTVDTGPQKAKPRTKAQ